MTKGQAVEIKEVTAYVRMAFSKRLIHPHDPDVSNIVTDVTIRGGRFFFIESGEGEIPYPLSLT